MTTRTCGILLHPTSLPGRYGIGDLGDSAYRFVDFLVAAGMRLWQVLPLGPTGYGDSPYQSFSAFAGNPLLVSPDTLVEQGLLTHDDVKHVPRFHADRVDFGPVIDYKTALLATAYERFRAGNHEELAAEFEAFCLMASDWLDTYAIFRTLKASFGGKAWNEWDEPVALGHPSAVSDALEGRMDEIEMIKFGQFLFFRQWFALKEYCNERGIDVVGDAPIFVAYDSSDVWAHRSQFKLDARGNPIVVAGVPPDYFSKTGQLWGNPIYDWDHMRSDGYAWWIERMRASMLLFDAIRLDHFRGFCACWEVPAGEETAVNGKWVPAPGMELFLAIRDALGRLPILAEDLGVITPDVEALRDSFGFPGMRILQFAFGADAKCIDLPHNYVQNCIVYTGTHDNDTTVGWYTDPKRKHATKERSLCREYLHSDGLEIHWDLIRAAFASIANTAIVPMQDVLGLGSEARMNLPASASGNWMWRMPHGALTTRLSRRLHRLAEIFGRLETANQ